MEKWLSPSLGVVNLSTVISEVTNYINYNHSYDYEIRIGTDSQKHNGRYVYVTSIIVRRVGKGARFFYKKRFEDKTTSLEERMWQEAVLSLECAESLTKLLILERFTSQVKLCVDLDLGTSGETKRFANAISGMISSYGYETKIKPGSYAASCVADKYTK